MNVYTDHVQIPDRLKGKSSDADHLVRVQHRPNVTTTFGLIDARYKTDSPVSSEIM